MLKYDAVETLERAEIEGPGVRHMTPELGGPNSKVTPFGWSLLKILPVPVLVVYRTRLIVEEQRGRRAARYP
jgi:hypothetical protein